MKNIKDYKVYMFEGCDRTGKSTFINYLKNRAFSEFGLKSFTFHLMGPSKFKDLEFTNDEKSLIQLAKFNDEYDLIREMISEDDNIRVILDRTSFGEYIWTRYWNRAGKYTDYVTSDEFITKHIDVLKNSLYIEFYMSDIDELEKRIIASKEDTKIFTINNRSIKDNILYVYDLYAELEEIIKKNGIDYLKVDASYFKSFKDDEKYIQRFFQ